MIAPFKSPLVWPEPTAQQVHLWQGTLDVSEDLLSSCLNTLSLQEHQRRERLTTSLLQRQFAAARGQLRFLLSRYLKASPADLRLSSTPRGKPFLQDFPDLHFNVSHSGHTLLIGVARSPLGVDVEHIPPDFNPLELLRFFSPEEQDFIKSGPVERFFWCWTRKEARLKATGEGLTAELAQLNTLHPLPGWEWHTCTFAHQVQSVACQTGMQIQHHPLEEALCPWS
ncbi:4'-phosphopantetheinyl transferase family protein [Deinococcus roseus]|uniref:4'-phosphopantetheinyl transferase domain-containing protein n=1 Tax=Deinococcus roseus TaxID=392414 RepID=A0ABQ2DC16_9DEIO|nr:4'-phosphopantetheinyl transferase superfamily protein [Deinococcus roseus]GGJ52730.1 hypothetical protein GCM10008938_43350 [Deinococcus roseus]